MKQPKRVLAAALVASILLPGCKRESGNKSGSSSVASGRGTASSADGGAASGPGAVSVTGHVAAYQNIHIEVPWDINDPVRMVATAQDAAAGKGLKLSDGTSTLEISSDGKSLRSNGRDYGTLHFGDHVVLTKDGKLTVNGVERQPELPASKPVD